MRPHPFKSGCDEKVERTNVPLCNGQSTLRAGPGQCSRHSGGHRHLSPSQLGLREMAIKGRALLDDIAERLGTDLARTGAQPSRIPTNGSSISRTWVGAGKFQMGPPNTGLPE